MLPDRPLDPRRQVGRGWGIHNKIAAGDDVSGGGPPELLATGKSAALWLHKGTGNAGGASAGSEGGPPARGSVPFGPGHSGAEPAPVIDVSAPIVAS